MSDIRYYTDGTQATAANLNKPLEDLNKQGQYISKAEFDNLAEMRRNAYAGSGVIDKNIDVTHGIYRGSQIWAYNYPDNPELNSSINLGENYLNNVNGVVIKLKNINTTERVSRIKLPEVNPQVSIITDSTNMPEMKQGDMAIYNDISERVPAVTSFGDYGSCTHTTDANSLTFTLGENTSGVWSGVTCTLDSLVKGVRYSFNVDTSAITDTGGLGLYVNIDGDKPNFGYLNLDTEGHLTVNFIANKTGAQTLYLNLRHDNSGQDNNTVTLSNISIKLLKEQPITALNNIAAGTAIMNVEGRSSISRQDLVFLETWHEDVSEKGLVYPYGNVQYKAENTDGLSGIQDGAFAGADTYSLFGNWQTAGDLVGKGYIWLNLSNEENNIYKEGDKIIQVRHRIKVMKGLNNDWINLQHLDFQSNGSAVQPNPGLYLRLQGQSNYVTDYGNDNGSIAYIGKNYGNDIGTYGKTNNHAMPIALVQRRNSGAYDPVHNPDGSAVFSDGKKWFETADSRNSIMDCFNNKGDSTIGTVSGRPDNLFSDEVNERDIEDLRMSALKRDYKELMDEYNNKAINGKIRGKTNQVGLKEIYSTTSNIRSFWMPDGLIVGGGFQLYSSEHPNIKTSISHKNFKIGETLFIIAEDGTYLKASIQTKQQNHESMRGYILETTFSPDDFTFIDGSYYTNNKKMFTKGYISDSESNNTIAHTDIIGDPRKLSQRVKYVVVDGTEQIVDLKKNDYVLNSDGKYYRNLVERNAIDLDTDNFTSVTNWLELGSDGTLGGYPQEWLKNGIQGSPLLYNEDDESVLLPDLPGGIQNSHNYKYIKLSKKYNNTLKVISFGTESGTIVTSGASGGTSFGDTVQWATLDDDGHPDETGVFNRGNILVFDTDRLCPDGIDKTVILVTYNTDASFLNIVKNNKVLSYNNDIMAGGHYQYSGKALPNFLLNKVNTNYSEGEDICKITKGAPSYAGGNVDIFRFGNNTSNNAKPEHTPIIKLKSSAGPSTKWLNYLTEHESVARLQYIFKELIWDLENDSYTDLVSGTTYTLKKGDIVRFPETMDNNEIAGTVCQLKKDYSMTLENNFWISNWFNEKGDLLTSSGSIDGNLKRWDGNGWGDDNQLQVIDEVSIMEDDNGNSVLYGQKSFNLPYFLKD